MTMRLLVGLDRREGGRDALALARALAAGGEARAHVATVVYPGPLPVDYVLLPEEEAEEAGPLLEAARAELEEAGIEVEAHAYGGGSPAGILTTIAEREPVDAIVVGSPHRGAIGRVMLGSVADSLLNGAPVEVAVAPRGYAERRPEPVRRIAVAYDGGPEARAALTRAESLARRHRARLELVAVVKPPVAAPAMVPGVYSPQVPLEPDRILNRGIGAVSPDLAAEAVRLDGDPAVELERFCAEGVDLLVAGSRGYGPVTRVLLGSVSRHLAQHASCPVLVVPRPEAGA